MMHNMMSGMGWGMGLVGLLGIAVLVLSKPPARATG